MSVLQHSHHTEFNVPEALFCQIGYATEPPCNILPNAMLFALTLQIASAADGNGNRFPRNGYRF